MDTREAVQNRVIELCQAKRWSFNALANYSGIPSGTMKNIVNGRSQNPGIVTIKKICDGLEISLGEFFNTADFQTLEQEIK
ncbi:MAG: helix-turn-helix domain-containing protein [Defluviitaleaceae bacterium]|nr:helix-turn-helix domain-containing protein [Defluviitaleaceae bacterium]